MEVGEKVKIKNILRAGCNYGGRQVDDNYKVYRNLVDTITSKEYNYSIRNYIYKLQATGDMEWTYEMFNPDYKENATVVEEGTTTNQQSGAVINNSIDFTEVVGAIKTLTNKIDSRTLYDESMQDLVREKVKNISTDELLETINKKVDKHIKDTYGMLPT